MNIRIIKNAEDVNGSRYNEKYILLKEYEPSEFEGINIIHYFLYEAAKNIKYEVLPEIKKYDVFKIRKLSHSEDIYFSTISKGDTDERVITLSKYNVNTEEIVEVYNKTEEISKYNEYKKVKAFVINDFYILFQNEYITINNTDTYKGYFEFKQYLFCVKEKKIVDVVDEYLRNSGITCMKSIGNNICVIKTGYDVLRDNRYENLSEDEACVERISYTNMGQLVTDILKMSTNIVLDTIDETKYTDTMPYISVKGKHLVYSKINIQTHRETVCYYNYDTKEKKQFINENVLDMDDLAWCYLINDIPYIRTKNPENTVKLLNLMTNHIDVEFDEGIQMCTAVNDYLIMKKEKGGILGRHKPVVQVYSFPDKKLLHQEIGEFIGCINTDDMNMYILVK